MRKPALTLIGMPNVGKSTVSHLLADALRCDLLDLDATLENNEGRSLVDILNAEGATYFLNKEYALLTQANLQTPLVISTPGSIIYHQPMSDWVSEHSLVILLNSDLLTLEKRLEDHPKAIVGLERGLPALYEERLPMYRALANMEIDTTSKSADEVAQEILTKLP